MTEGADRIIQSKVTAVKGIGPKKADYLNKLNIETVEDFLYFFPRDYEDRRNIRKINSLQDGEVVLIKGKLIYMLKGKMSRRQPLRVLIQDNSGSIEVVFFNGGYLAKTLKLNEEYILYGKVSVNQGRLQMLHPDITKYDSDQMLCIVPIYPLTSGITQGEMRKWQKKRFHICII